MCNYQVAIEEVVCYVCCYCLLLVCVVCKLLIFANKINLFAQKLANLSMTGCRHQDIHSINNQDNIEGVVFNWSKLIDLGIVLS